MLKSFLVALEIAKILMALGPAMIGFIKGVEELMPESGRGKEKAEIVRVTIETAFEKLDGITVVFEDFWKLAEPWINNIVDLFNRNGVFKKG